MHNYGAVRQLELTVRVAYGSDLDQVLATAREVLARNPRVLPDLTPVVGVEALGEAGVTVTVAPWVAVPDYIPARAELYQELAQAMRAREISVGVPQREVRLVSR